MDVPEPVRRFLDQGASSLLLAPDAAPGEYDAVAAVVRDRAGLRALAVPADVVARAVAVFVASGPVTLVPPRDWPLVRLRVRPAAGGSMTVLRFSVPVEVAEVVAEVGRQSVYGRSGDLGRVARGERGPGSPPDPPGQGSGDLGRVAREQRRPGPPPDGPDPRVLNPIGFDPTASAPVVDAATVDLGDGATEQLVASLRSAAGVRVTAWDDATVAAVRGMAMAGVPVTAATAPDELAPIAAALTAPVDLEDGLAREEHSIVLRRAALDAWAGFRQPAVSSELATRRPDMLAHALGQVARQRGVDSLELVLAPHGFDADEARARELLGPGVALTVRPQPAPTIFGDVLHEAARAAGGDVVLKMDDDDWYSPDAIADLLRARAYSGAELVGMPAEFHYIEERDLTVRRGHTTELYATFVAGGTMMVDRSVLREVGGFRSVRKYVDAQLLAAVRRAGGSVYRTHGLGYLLRRTASGHTWQVDLDYLLDPARVAATYDGFRPSRLMELPG